MALDIVWKYCHGSYSSEMTRNGNINKICIILLHLPQKKHIYMNWSINKSECMYNWSIHLPILHCGTIFETASHLVYSFHDHVLENKTRNAATASAPPMLAVLLIVSFVMIFLYLSHNDFAEIGTRYAAEGSYPAVEILPSKEPSEKNSSRKVLVPGIGQELPQWKHSRR